MEEAVEAKPVQEMVQHQMRLAHIPPDLLEDARQEAWIGVLEATQRYNGSTKIRTFASHRCSGRIKDFMRREDPLTRGQRKKVQAGEAEPVQILSTSLLTDHECWTQLGGLPRDKLRASDTSLTASTDVAILMSFLSPKERRVISMFYLEERSAREIAGVLGCCVGWIVELRRNALARMRRSARCRKFEV